MGLAHRNAYNKAVLQGSRPEGEPTVDLFKNLIKNIPKQGIKIWRAFYKNTKKAIEAFQHTQLAFKTII